jgi:hypothetical protein
MPKPTISVEGEAMPARQRPPTHKMSLMHAVLLEKLCRLQLQSEFEGGLNGDDRLALEGLRTIANRMLPEELAHVSTRIEGAEPGPAQERLPLSIFEIFHRALCCDECPSSDCLLSRRSPYAPNFH